MSIIANMIGKKNIAEAEKGIEGVEKQVEAADAKVTPFVAKVAPLLPIVLPKLLAMAPELAAVVTPAEIAEFAEGVAAIPGIFKALEAGLKAAEAKIETV